LNKSRRLLRNFLTLFAGNVTGQLFFFLGLAYLARVLGPSEFGVWNFAQVWMLYLLRAGEFGLEVVGVRQTSRELGLASRWIAIVVSTRVVLALLLFGLIMLVSVTGLLPSGTKPLVIISALAVFPMAILLEWVFEARQEVRLISIARILKGVLFFLGVLFAVSHEDDAEVAAYLYVGSLVIPALVMFVVVVRRFGFDWYALSVRGSMEALGKSAPIGIATLLSQYSLSVTPMVVGYLLSKEDLGYFTAAHRIVLFMWAYITSSMQRILLPSLSSYFRESVPQFQQFVEKFFRLSTLTAVPVGLVATLLATPLMVFLYSDQYESSGIVFAIVVWAFVVANVRCIVEIGLIASDEHHRYMKGMIVLAVVYTVVTPILTLKYGIVGAAAAAVISESVYFAYLLLAFPHLRPVSFLKNAWKPILAALLAMIVMYSFDGMHASLRGMISLGVFMCALLMTKGVTLGDFEMIRSVLRRSKVEPST